MASTREGGFVRVASVEDLREAGTLRVTADGRAIGLFYHEERVYAVDDRCPHMGFPLTRGTVDDGVLTCHWHHARFELSCGDTFDPFADDVRAYPVDVRDGEVWVDPDPDPEESPREHWARRLEDGLQEDLSLVVAKAVVGLDDAGAPPDVPLRVGVEFGTAYRAGGWGSGLTTLAAMANLGDAVERADRRRALYAGLVEVAGDCAGEPPFFAQDPFATSDVAPGRLESWFRETVDVRDADGAERVLRTAIAADLPRPALVTMLVGAVTDHRYLDSGHRLDFLNKAVETLDRLGWEHADAVLPSLVPGLTAASRAEERASWRQPVDLAALLDESFEALPALVEAGADREWTEPDGFVETLLSDDPHAILAALRDAIEGGASARELAEAVAFAATRRIAQFGTGNEFGDWNTVHHTFTYANALHGLAGRVDGWTVYRGVFDAAASVYLDRFLNTPPAPLPDPGESPRAPEAVLDDLLETFEVEGPEQVARSGALTAEYVDAGGDVDALGARLGHALLREDAGFHPRQNLEAAFRLHDVFASAERKRVALVAAARYLAAHTPTRRAGEQTFTIADRLHRGEQLHEA